MYFMIGMRISRHRYIYYSKHIFLQSLILTRKKEGNFNVLLRGWRTYKNQFRISLIFIPTGEISRARMGSMPHCEWCWVLTRRIWKKDEKVIGLIKLWSKAGKCKQNTQRFLCESCNLFKIKSINSLCHF